MYFSLGGHPAFQVPALAGTRRSDYFLTFDGQDELTYIQIDDQESLAFPDKKYRLALREGRCSIDDHMFDKYMDSMEIKAYCISYKRGNV